MWAIIGLLLLAIAVVMGVAFLGDWLADFSGIDSNNASSSRRKKQKRAYRDEKAKSVYTAASKSLKLNLMQMEAFRQMSEAAEKHWKQPHQSTMFDDIDL